MEKMYVLKPLKNFREGDKIYFATADCRVVKIEHYRGKRIKIMFERPFTEGNAYLEDDEDTEFFCRTEREA